MAVFLDTRGINSKVMYLLGMVPCGVT